MQLHPTSRSRRVRRLLAVSAAAVAVMIAPTACNYGGAAQMDMPTHSGHMDGMNMDDPAQPGAPEEHQVVPVANQVPATAAPAADDDATTTAAARADRRRSDGDRRRRGDQPTTSATTPVPAGETTPTTETTAPTDPPPTSAPPAAPGVGSVGAGGADGKNNGLQILGRDCTASGLKAHDGFQNSPACVSTEMGEIAAEDSLPSLLITDAPKSVGVNQAFTLKVSTRNLVRDRFLGAKAGGYYLESSFLNADGLQRGHFHTACRTLSSTTEAPNSGVAPEFFLATEDGGGSRTPDTVTIEVPGIKTAGELQCTSWAGDGSHRTPMMTKANETPAIDSVRITVTPDAQPVQADQAAADADVAKQVEVKQQESAQKPDSYVTEPAAGATGGAAPASSEAPAAKPAAPAAESPAAQVPTAETPAAN